MVAHFLEASVMFQNSDVFLLYAIIFGSLAIMCGATYFSAMKNKVE